jgi:hypothetical protein
VAPDVFGFKGWQRERGGDFEGGDVRRQLESHVARRAVRGGFKKPLHRMVRQVKDTLADIKNKHGVNLKYL